jgi:hypothetical protein
VENLPIPMGGEDMWAATDEGVAKGTRPSASISAKAGEVCRSAARPTGAMVARPTVDGRGSPTTARRESRERRPAPPWVFLDSIVSLILPDSLMVWIDKWWPGAEDQCKRRPIRTRGKSAAVATWSTSQRRLLTKSRLQDIFCKYPLKTP